MVSNLWSWIWGSGLGFGVLVLDLGFWSWIWDSGLRFGVLVLDLGFWSWIRGSGLGFGVLVLDLGFWSWIWGSGLVFRVLVLDSGFWSWIWGSGLVPVTATWAVEQDRRLYSQVRIVVHVLSAESKADSGDNAAADAQHNSGDRQRDGKQQPRASTQRRQHVCSTLDVSDDSYFCNR